ARPRESRGPGGGARASLGPPDGRACRHDRATPRLTARGTHDTTATRRTTARHRTRPTPPRRRATDTTRSGTAGGGTKAVNTPGRGTPGRRARSEEHTSEL